MRPGDVDGPVYVWGGGVRWGDGVEYGCGAGLGDGWGMDGWCVSFGGGEGEIVMVSVE